MAGAPNPFRDAYPWGHLIIGGILLPGVIEAIDDCSKPETWIYQKGLAASQAVSIWRGTNLAESIKITTRLSNEDQFDEAVRVRNILKPARSRRPPVLPVLNGQMDFVGIKRVSIKEIFPPVAAAGLSWSWKIILTEFNPMKPVPVGPADAPKKESENDRLEKEFSGLVKKAAGYGFP